MESNVEKQENLDEIKKYLSKALKKEGKISKEELNKILVEANENIDFLKVLDEINIDTTGKRVIFVDGKACLVYDSGIFYIEDSIDAKKKKKKLTHKEATELYVEYFFRYIMNPAIEKKKMMENVRSVTSKTKKAPTKTKSQSKVEVKTEDIKEEKIVKITRRKIKEENIR